MAPSSSVAPCYGEIEAFQRRTRLPRLQHKVGGDESCQGQMQRGKQGTPAVKDNSLENGADSTIAGTIPITSLAISAPSSSQSLTSCLSSTTKRGNRNRDQHVKFDSISIRQYQVVLGDNPEVSAGPPLSLGWSFSSFGPIPLEAYESHKQNQDRREGHDLVVPAFMRRQILLRNHISTNAEIVERVKEVRVVRSQRDRTVKMLPLAKVEEGAQSAKRKAARAASRVLKRESDTIKNCASLNKVGYRKVIH